MRIIISPAKKMEECSDLFAPGGVPVFLERTRILHEKLKAMSEPELKALFKANDRITGENYIRFQNMDLDRALTPALLSYVGIQYQYMAPRLFSNEQWEYAGAHLRILSGFYGVLKPDDSVLPYRLEMQAKLEADGKRDLYDFWGRDLLEAVIAGEEDRLILNLASKEYSRAIEPHLTPKIRFVTCVFGSLSDEKIKVKATEAKMARGEMVRYLAENGIQDLDGVKAFEGFGYRYCPERSQDDCIVFLKQPPAAEV